MSPDLFRAVRIGEAGPSAGANSIHHSAACLALVFLTVTGCGQPQPPPTLVIHAHNGQYDFIDYQGGLLGTADGLHAFEATLRRPTVQKLIRRNHVILRFEGLLTENGLSYPDESAPVLVKLFANGITHVEFDDTNDLPHH